MSVEALPYTLLVLLAQFGAGVGVVLILVHVRSGFEPSFLRIISWLTVTGAFLTALTALVIDPRFSTGGYSLDPEFLDPVRGLAVAMLLFSVAYAYFLRKEDEDFLARATGATTAALGIILLILLGYLVRLPTWNVGGAVLIFFAGALTIGASTVAMIWGHWYLVKPSLDERPLNELALLVLAALIFETVIIALNAIIPVGEPLQSNALLAIDLPENPAFWLRIGIGVLFPVVLTFMAYTSSKERAMMSATGLLYIAVGAILAGEAVGRGLLFVTGAPV